MLTNCSLTSFNKLLSFHVEDVAFIEEMQGLETANLAICFSTHDACVVCVVLSSGVLVSYCVWGGGKRGIGV